MEFITIAALTNLQGGSTPFLASVAASTSSVTLVAANTARKSIVIVNDSASADLYIKLGGTASATSYTYLLAPKDILDKQLSYTGIIDGIWSAAVGAARVTELS
jgi:hypothetical protein